MRAAVRKKRSPVPFDAAYFRKKAAVGERYSTAETFEYIYRANHWSGKDSVSGEGSGLRQTAEIKKELITIVRELGVRVFLDLPCGDCGWMGGLELPVDAYIGGDIVPGLVEHNRRKYGDARKTFLVLDIIRDPLPAADLLFCRDCFVHLSLGDIMESLANIRRSSVRYLLATTFPECDANEDILTGDWRVINLEKPPFNFPEPIRLINEKCTEGQGTYGDKSLGLWEVRSLAP